MWGERIKRLLIIITVALLVMWGAKSLINRQAKQKAQGKVVSLTASVDQFLTDMTGKVLGLAVSKLTGNKSIKDKVIPATILEGEPISEPVENVQTQTQQLIESIKKLPEDQITAVKKQIMKDFCQKFLQE